LHRLDRASFAWRTGSWVKEVVRSGLGADGRPWRRRYIVCRNEAEAQKDKAARDAILAALEATLRRGDKSLVGNRGYRRFLKPNLNTDLDKYSIFQQVIASRLVLSTTGVVWIGSGGGLRV
jgi:hypothetical protein